MARIPVAPIKHRRGSTLDHSTFIGAEGEFTFDSDKKTVVAHDGEEPGGYPLARESTDAGEPVRSENIIEVRTLFQDEYNAIEAPDDSVLYVIVPRKVVMQPGTLNWFPNDTILGTYA